MLNKTSYLKIIVLAFFLGIIFIFPGFAIGDSPDTIAMRVIPNPDHVSALDWYNENVSLKGTPQVLTVDGYQAIRDGRTVYVNAANVDISVPSYFTNIYIISFNQQAEKPTEDIFGQILSDWQFNSNLNTSPGQCLNNNSINCLIDDACTGYGICTSYKARVIRDTIRLERLNSIKILIDKYKEANSHYPILSSGTYIKNNSLSVWPSWLETLGQLVKTNLPLDPLNKLDTCPSNYEKNTCWDKIALRFYWAADLAASRIPDNNFTFLYKNDNQGTTYKLCGLSEIGFINSPLICNASCVPFCVGRECDSDGCGGTCGSCGPGQACDGGSCVAGCTTAPGCRSSLANGYVALGFCTSGNCYNCNASYNWNSQSQACVTSCVPDGCNGNCPFNCSPAQDPDCAGACCGNGICDSGETTATCSQDCPLICADNDNDGYGNPGSPSCAQTQTDCNDSDPAIHPGAAEICGNGIDEDCSGADLNCAPICADNDSDGYGNPASAACAHAESDCNDNNSTIHPNGIEICNGLDDNCNGTVDDNCDIDNDNYCGCANNFTYGSDLTGICPGTNTTDAAAVANTCDCSDNNANIHPGGTETCGNGIDEDCNGSDLDCSLVCNDSDNDGYGNPSSSACPHVGLDCNNNNINIHPGTNEICDGIDNNCSGTTDEGCDIDNDNYCGCANNFTYGSDLTATCPGTNTTDAAAIANTCDCSDNNANIHPGGTETCGNGIDEDCSGSDLDCSLVCNDSDNDGYGNPSSSACPHVGLDCNNNNVNIHPGANEICDGIDNNCSGTTDESCDIDNDNYCGCSYIYVYGSDLTGVCPGTNTTNVAAIANTCDCNDNSAGSHPGASETCGNGIDEDCSGADLACPPACVDNDGDGYGNPASAACPQAQLDCDDTRNFINPGATETCDNNDNNCSGQTDEGCDNDNDDYCDANLIFYNYPVAVCSNSNLANGSTGDDCNDNSAAVHPGATEICGNGIDEDCSGADLTCPPVCVDTDSDGYGSPGSISCIHPELDCNNNNAAIHPGAPEICGNGIDEDCSGADLACPIPFCTFPITFPCIFN